VKKRELGARESAMIRRILSSASISPKSKSSSPKRASIAVDTSSTRKQEILTSQQISMLIRRASEEGNADELKKLLERDGATAKAHTRPGNTTALHCAAFRGHYEVCRILLSHGADPNAVDDFERSALHRAARKGHKQVLRLLIDRGSDVLMYDSNGLLASDLAAKKKFDPSVTKVLPSLSLSHTHTHTHTPLKISASKGCRNKCTTTKSTTTSSFKIKSSFSYAFLHIATRQSSVVRREDGYMGRYVVSCTNCKESQERLLRSRLQGWI